MTSHSLYDMGKVRSSHEPSGDKKEKYYPSITLSSKQLSELKGKKFGDNVEIYFKGEISGMHEDYEDKTEAEYEIKILEAGMKGKGKDEYMKMSNEDKDKADEKEVMDKK